MNNRSRLALGLALALLLLRISRVSADENSVGYRREFYREDDNRIHVDTESGHIDTALNSKIRLNVDMVMDTISGATPTGAPPQSKWPFPTFGNLYQSAFGQAYTGLFGQFTNANQIYVDNNLESYHDMTNAAAAFANAGAGTIATNNASSSFHSLTNNPNFRKNSVPLTYMHDYRLAFSLGFPITLGKKQVFTPSYAFSEESDYVSRGLAFNDSITFNNKNTTLNLGYSRNADKVKDDNFIWQDKLSDDFLVGVVQLLGKKSYLTVNGVMGHENGYLSDPYRGVMPLNNLLQTNPDDAALIPEKRPRHRTKGILDISWTQFITPLNGSLEAGYRYFHDTWGTDAHTLDLHWHQKIGKKFVISPGFRYYYQTAASFYGEFIQDFNHPPTVYSADYRLSELESFSYSLRMSYRVHRHLSLEAGYLRYAMFGLDGKTSQSAFPAANVFSIGARIWF